MRRERIRRKNNSLKYQIYISGVALVILIITFITVYAVYRNKLKELSESFKSPELITSLVPNTENEITNKITETSTELSKTIDEALNNNISVQNTEVTDEPVENVAEEPKIEEAEPTAPKVEEAKVLEFAYPVDGEISKEYAMENLLFSETLQEWTIHPGIDIKCERATVVKAAEDGTIFAIKNDPRYGTTIIVDHRDGYKTIYSNLLTTEFVTEKEKVVKGQSLGTVGNSAVFEIADEAHLHFEMTKDEVYINPKIYLK